jgi:hypothetical protein
VWICGQAESVCAHARPCGRDRITGSDNGPDDFVDDIDNEDAVTYLPARPSLSTLLSWAMEAIIIAVVI